MEDFEPPSFSLGFDLDLASEPQTAPRPEPSTSYILKPANRSSSKANLRPRIDEDDDDFEMPPMGFDSRVSDPPRALKRLRLGHISSAQKGKSKEEMFNVDDDIEDFSSQEDPTPVSVVDDAPKHHHSFCSSSKFTLNGHRRVTSESAIQQKERRKKEVSNVSNASTSNKLVIPKLHVSPVRKFQLIDSDSEEPSSPEALQKVVNGVEFSSKDRAPGPSLVEAAAEVKKFKASVNLSQPEDLWKGIHSETTNIPTPAFDEVFEEYFRSVKSNNEFRNNDTGGIETSNFITNNVEEHVSGPQPPAHAYYYHVDPRIQKLVRSRLPTFFPLEAGNNRGQKQLNASPIDYLSQFNHRESSKHGKKGPKARPSLRRSHKNARKPSAQELSLESETWINPRSSAKKPKDAGKRRIRAVGKSAGHWYTAGDGRRVYVAGNGQELTGQTAYRNYRRESGAGFKKSKRNAAKKKKSASKKK